MQQIDSDTLAVLSTVHVKGNLAFIPGKLDRKVYEKVNKVLTSIGGKWNRGKQAHVFEEEGVDALLDTVIALRQITTKKDTGFFPTPEPLADRLVAEAGVKPGFVCLEPSAGTGNIVRAIHKVGGRVIAIERDEKMRKALIKSGLCDVAPYDDFMEIEVPTFARFDAIIMNPPFYKIGKGNHLDHTRLAFSLLKPGGILRSILPSSVKFRVDQPHTAFRSWAKGCGGSFEELPDNSFRESGTGVSTVVLRMKA